LINHKELAMSNLVSRSKPKGIKFLQSLSSPALASIGVLGAIFALQLPIFLYFAVALSILFLRFPDVGLAFASSRWFQRLGGWKTCGVLLGVLFFSAIVASADPAAAQLFDTVENEANSIFGDYLDSNIVTFLFGVLRIVIWVAAAGFVFFAVYQAQRGEQWQPLIQNAFIVVAAVVLIEGLSAFFFGG
jgi:hypothetical protein